MGIGKLEVAVTAMKDTIPIGALLLMLAMAAPASARQEQQPGRQQQEIANQQAQPVLSLSVEGNLKIPAPTFRSRFGSQHPFRIWGPMRKDGLSRFQQGGVIFGFLQQWPAGWYYTDLVYVESLEGRYFLCNPSHPGVFLPITVIR